MGPPGDVSQCFASDRTGPPPDSRIFRWVPIRSLSDRHRPRIVKHLLSLNDSDRYLRFGYPATENQVGAYVDRIDFERDEVFGIFNRRLELIAVAHLAYLGEGLRGQRSSELGVSVLERYRMRGYGARLFDHAVLHARSRGVDRLVIHALSENEAMLKIARSVGATVVRSGPEAQAHLELSPDDVASPREELVESVPITRD